MIFPSRIIRTFAKQVILLLISFVPCLSTPHYSIRDFHAEMWSACFTGHSIYVGRETGVQEMGDTVLVSKRFLSDQLDTNRLRVVKRTFRITRNIVGWPRDLMDAIDILGEPLFRYGAYTLPQRYGKEHVLIFDRDGKYLAAHGMTWPEKNDSLNQHWKQFLAEELKPYFADPCDCERLNKDNLSELVAVAGLGGHLFGISEGYRRIVLRKVAPWVGWWAVGIVFLWLVLRRLAIRPRLIVVVCFGMVSGGFGIYWKLAPFLSDAYWDGKHKNPPNLFAEKVMKTIPGFKKVKKHFTIESRYMECDLKVVLKAKKNTVIQSIGVTIPFENGEPRCTWENVLESVTVAEEKFRNMKWIQDWLALDDHRFLRLETGCEFPIERFGARRVDWEEARIPGQPRHWLDLKNDTIGNTRRIVFGDQTDSGLICESEWDMKSSHPLDKIPTLYDRYYGVVDEKGQPTVHLSNMEKKAKWEVESESVSDSTKWERKKKCEEQNHQKFGWNADG